MAELRDLFQSGDWKQEKHVPAIEIAAAGDGAAEAVVSVGKDIPHPNTTAHHIAWIEVYFLPDGAKFPYQIARTDFAAHGASAQGPDTSGVFAAPTVRVSFKTGGPGTVFAAAYCNIHGLWQGSAPLK